jgi:hypothetical protein
VAHDQIVFVDRHVFEFVFRMMVTVLSFYVYNLDTPKQKCDFPPKPSLIGIDQR